MVRAVKYVEVEVELSDFDTDELIEELENRGIQVPDDAPQDILELYNLRRFDDTLFDAAFANFVYEKIGRIL